MNKFISLMNPVSLLYLWNSQFKHYVENMVNEIINSDDAYTILETFNKSNQNLRSYFFLESKEKIILIDFNFIVNDDKLNNNLDIINYLKIVYKKEVILIIFNAYKSNNYAKDNIYLIYKNNNNNNFINFLLSDNKKEQESYGYDDLIKFLSGLDDDFYHYYLREMRKL